MVSWSQYERAVARSVRRDIRELENAAQHTAISAHLGTSLFIVAGPGSGKTTVIALRILKLVMVDGIHPRTILATTFTRKAAAELRSRILGWGDDIRQTLVASIENPDTAALLKAIDFNQVRTGTIDSIAEELLTEFKPPGIGAPTIVQEFVANGLMLRAGLFRNGRHRSPSLRSYVNRLRGGSYPPLNAAALSATVREIRDRVIHDQVDLDRYRESTQDRGVLRLCDAINDYDQELADRQLYDFSQMEKHLLDTLRAGGVESYLGELRFLLVDEYQDTNLLQEQVYFALAQAARNNGGSIAIVGDDDQSLYRFRGATVDLFQAFPDRLASAAGIVPERIDLTKNYRSTTTIVDHVNLFVTLDPSYQKARVADKPPIGAARPGQFSDFPILGMFRRDCATLAADLAQFIHEIVHGRGVTVGRGSDEFVIALSPDGGTPADVVLLASTPQEFSSTGKERLSRLLRLNLRQLDPPIAVFNPRGQALQNIECVQQLCGLVLECIDPGATVQTAINNLPREVARTLTRWRQVAQSFSESDPEPHQPASLAQFLDAWARRQPLGRRVRKMERVPLNDLIYKLVTWIPLLQDDIEGLVYLEAVARTITESARLGSFEACILFDTENVPLSSLTAASVREAIWNILVPLASGAIEVNEDLLETLPSERISVMSIHQAKGLEFPMVVIDVGSDFKTAHPSQAFRRFPNNPGEPSNLENELRAYSLGLEVPPRAGVDRAFDDLVRQYYVAYSRAQDVLLLVGLTSSLNGIPNVATGWDRDENWHWGAGLPNLTHI